MSSGFKFDAVVGQLRDDKQDAFIRMMTECRKYSPDVILLNHRLNLSEDAEALYEATVFAADNNALEVRSLLRSGNIEIPEVKAAREAFTNQRLSVERGLIKVGFWRAGLSG